MKHQALSTKKDKSIKIKCRLLQILFGALKVKLYMICAKRKDFDWTALMRKLV